MLVIGIFITDITNKDLLGVIPALEPHADLQRECVGNNFMKWQGIDILFRDVAD